nr:type II toxin-antitoxin system Phd/YefM family antitoxin [uncultured Clostridium sp.]
MKYCNRNGCNKLVPQGVRYCEAHSINRAAENKERHKEYDAHCRNQTAKAFYNSGEWRAARARTLARDTGIDIYLYITTGEVVPADMVHNMKTYMDKITDDYETMIVTRKDNKNVVILSEESYNNMMENIYVMGNKCNYDWLMESKAQLENGMVSLHDLPKVEADE